MRSQWLALTLKGYRLENQLSIDEVADFLGTSSSTVSRMENALTQVRRADLKELLDHYNISDPDTRAKLIELRDIAWRRDWWDGMVGTGQETTFADYAWLESRAKSIRSFEALALFGLFQTRAYAEAVIRGAAVDEDREEKITEWVDLRLRRQEILDHSASPELDMVIDESALHRQVGGPEVMREQLMHLAELARRDRITIRVLPFANADHAAYCGTFTYFTLGEHYPDVAYAETAVTRMFVEDPVKLDRLQTIYADLARAALTPSESIKLISSIAEGL
ncbi:helix-turn-helix domain-containing protein [Phytomonospora endophytica]|uniref:Transcriptional regulator with XRE-family HTH domain n=1 Tax=Phytomonospora endophytica TaxID=714109 RepID=A0A841F9K2_9ACTN|nr:helix-turn-helix transcriptional regulator [Phytomonospora endophytica]MBB6032926.1 transcriptional regulator with XRE-family HTH domain [Phytomonospora endophytica]GIG65152.1 transcriptional regulator [Phytomonospora endophytica]